MAERRKVATLSDITSDGLISVETDGTCPHQEGPLGDGLLEGKTITCPWHAWQFDVCNGRALYDKGFSVACYRVIVEGTDILIEV